MKNILQLFWVVAVFCSALVNGENSESSSSEETNCYDKPEVLIKRAVLCLAPNITLIKVMNGVTPEESRFTIKRYCYNRQSMRQCVQEVGKDSHKCLSYQNHRFFTLLQDFLEVIFDVACSHYGEKLARISQDISDLRNNNGSFQRLNDVVVKCLQASGLSTDTDVEMDLGKRITQAHKSIRSFKKCFNTEGRDLVRTAIHIEELLTDLLDKMKCYDPTSDAFALCKELNNYCPLARHDDVTHFTRQGFLCLENTVPKQLNISIAESRALIKDRCDKQAPVRNCFRQLASDAEDCLTDADTREAFNVFRRDLEDSIDVVCSGNGNKLARVIVDLNKLDQDSKNRIDDCINMQGGSDYRDPNVSLRTKIFLFYKRLKATRECFLENEMGAMTSVNEFADLSREILENMQCLHPDDHSVIRCRNLNDEGTFNRTCPELVGYDSEKQLRQHLFDSAFECISVKGIRFEQLTNESSPDELRAFFSEYCRGLPRVKDCLANVAHRAEICLGPPPHRIFKVLQQMLESALETGCTQDADRLVTVFGGLQRHGGASGEAADALYECIDMSVLKLKMVPESGVDEVTRVYRETESFQECLVEEIKDPEVKNLTDIFLTDVMRELKCQQPHEDMSEICREVRIEKSNESEENLV